MPKTTDRPVDFDAEVKLSVGSRLSAPAVLDDDALSSASTGGANIFTHRQITYTLTTMTTTTRSSSFTQG